MAFWQRGSERQLLHCCLSCLTSVRRPCLCHTGSLASELSCHAIDNPLFLTLIKIEHIQEIKLSLSHCNEAVSITRLFTPQSDQMIKLGRARPTRHAAFIAWQHHSLKWMAE